MSTQDKARELMAKERLTEEERHNKMVSRAVEAEEAYQENLEETARELLTEKRQNNESLQDNMRERAEEQIQQN
ncbi:MAG TPA: hypothetical protein DCF68_07400 [Cyanothece sp. UBA12306]|nr:hypothetical protein [Cyanothece sp. UBA12306]